MIEEQKPVDSRLTSEPDKQGSSVEKPIDKVPVDKAPEAPPTPTWQEVIDKVDAKELRKHSRIAGIVGSESQQAIENWKRKEGSQQAEQQRDVQEKAFLDLVEGNTDYIKEHHPLVFDRYSTMQKDRASREIEGARSQTVHQLATAIGRAVREVPEWEDLKPEDHQELAKELVDKPDEEVLPIFTRAALNLLATRRAEKMITEWREKELGKEREVIRQEEAAKLLAKTPAPEPRHGVTPGKAKVDVNGMSDEEFDTWYEKNVKGR